MTVTAPPIPAYRLFTARVVRVLRLSPGFQRVTFTGPDFEDLAPNGFDQRVKLLFPTPGRGLLDCPAGADWYGDWRALPEERRNPIRTYTVRAARPGEIDVDFVLHGATGPASAWAERAAAGDEVVLVGPDARFPGPTGGFEWRPPADASCVLIAGDETAVPAICAIVESLLPGRPGRVLLEVPTAGDVLDLTAPDGVRVDWLPRTTAGAAPSSPRGALLTAALVAAVRELEATPSGTPSGTSDVPEVDVDEGILWDVPAEAPAGSRPYVWLAGEAGVVKNLRRQLVGDLGLDRTAVAFMGYWREGRPGD
jgi:NADPH-dependent ferric siderophore reductase